MPKSNADDIVRGVHSALAGKGIMLCCSGWDEHNNPTYCVRMNFKTLQDAQAFHTAMIHLGLFVEGRLEQHLNNCEG